MGADQYDEYVTKADRYLLPDTPSTQPLYHAAVAHMVKVEERLSQNGVLAVIKGEPSPRTTTLIDMPLHRLPAVATTDPGYASVLRTRLQWETTNAANATKRFQATMEDWNKAYNLISASCERYAPQLKTVLRDNCVLLDTPLHAERGR